MRANAVPAALAAALLVALAAGAADAYGPYAIQTNSPVHVTGTGNEVALIYGDAPGAGWVEITIHDMTYEAQVRGGSFHITVPAPPPGTYDVSGVWRAESLEPSGNGWTEQTTTGHLEPALLTILGRGFGDVPDGTVTVLDGAHAEGCDGCVEYTTDVVDAGGYVLVTNADSANHRFVTDSVWAVRSTGNLDPGESVRLPLQSEGEAAYRCAYHPWLEFVVSSTGRYEPVESAGSIHLDAPPYAGDAVRVGITHTGGAAVAHVIFIQDGQVLAAGTAPLADGRGVYTVDASEWRVGEVIVSVSAGADHATDTISVRPPPGAAERTGRVTGYDGLDGILINGGLARPAGLIPLDAASEATRQVCQLDRDALFRGDEGLAPRGAHYTEGTVWCGGVNLGVYLLESGLAIADPVECGLARSDWLVPYCHGRQGGAQDAAQETVEDVEQDAAHDTAQDATQDAVQDAVHEDEQDATRGGAPDAMQDAAQGSAQGAAQDATQDAAPADAEAERDDRAPTVIPADVPAVPDAGGPEFERTGEDSCDPITDPECPCPEGWVRNGEWCDPDWGEGIGGAADAAGGAVGDAGGMIGDTVGGVGEGMRDSAVGALGGAFGWIADRLAEIPRLALGFGEWIVEEWG